VVSLRCYLLCGTPRTGSTLLCNLLASTGVAGRPESYFREPDEPMWAKRFGVSGSEAHDRVMSLYAGMSKGGRTRIKTRVGGGTLTPRAPADGAFSIAA
jgi:LPS sulfotransferase NodH